MSDYVSVQNLENKRNENKDDENKVYYKLGLKIACINVHGIKSSDTQRRDLYQWMVKHDIDVLCLQEWYLHHPFEEKIFSTGDKKLRDPFCFETHPL